ncbi:Histidine kinase [Zhouia amylolytica]|uniref:Histidine kinase n=1 Tax=Zhouia amylolytica TaxID=376730 RepID=A0A1I6P842_9FLAO|nr:histidine kinase [Zhouia amylolytica]MCQ0111798.1 histidine kinase [Zhouia amylolytica]SFS36361.1 Histidine kinase [Zhouia amylolytica]
MKDQVANRTIPMKYHLYFWIAYFLFNVVRWGSYFDDYWYSFKSNLVEFPLHILVVYFNIYFLIPRFILKKKYLEYAILFVICLGAHYVIRSGLNFWLVTEDIWPEAEGGQRPFGFNHIVAVVVGELYVVGLTSAIKFFADYIYERNKNQQLRELQYQTELKYLKSQIQPHFYFNTLNNLYALTLKKSSLASDVVLKLSEIMQYIIYDANKKKVDLIQEINYIDNYVELEKIRFGNLVDINIGISGDIDNIKVAPLIFLPFIENAFKHGLRNTNGMTLDIDFERLDGQLLFKCKNTFNANARSNNLNGIGVKNVERRLDILYGNKHKLDIFDKDDTYEVLLQVPIK